MAGSWSSRTGRLTESFISSNRHDTPRNVETHRRAAPIRAEAGANDTSVQPGRSKRSRYRSRSIVGQPPGAECESPGNCIFLDLVGGCYDLLLRKLPLQMTGQRGDHVAVKFPMDADGALIVAKRVREHGQGALGGAIARIAPVKSGGAAPEQIGARRQQAVRLIRFGHDNSCRSIRTPNSLVDPHRPLNGTRVHEQRFTLRFGWADA